MLFPSFSLSLYVSLSSFMRCSILDRICKQVMYNRCQQGKPIRNAIRSARSENPVALTLTCKQTSKRVIQFWCRKSKQNTCQGMSSRGAKKSLTFFHIRPLRSYGFPTLQREHEIRWKWEGGGGREGVGRNA